jgi:DNA-damage-inducible protein J
MVKNETLHIRVNENVKENAEKTLDLLGISIAEAVNMFLHQIPLVGGLPFEVKISQAPESVTVHNKEELYAALEIGMAQVRAGKVISAETVMERLRSKHGF